MIDEVKYLREERVILPVKNRIRKTYSRLYEDMLTSVADYSVFYEFVHETKLLIIVLLFSF